MNTLPSLLVKTAKVPEVEINEGKARSSRTCRTASVKTLQNSIGEDAVKPGVGKDAVDLGGGKGAEARLVGKDKAQRKARR